MDLHLLGFSGLTQVPNFHPAVVHFPVALVPAALVLYVIGEFSGRPGVLLGGKICLAMAAVTSLLSVLTGALAVADLPRTVQARETFDVHLFAAGLFMLVTLVLAGWSTAHEKHRPKRARLFLAVLLVDCLLVLQTADLGARLVYVQGAGVSSPR